MINWNKELNEFAAKVLNVTNPVNEYMANVNIVEKYKPTVLLFDGAQINNLQIPQYENADIKIKHMGHYENTAILNEKTLSMSSNMFQPIRIACIICLDSNIVSLLPRYFENKGKEKLNSFIEYLIDERINISSSPYLLEDSLNSTGMRNDVKVYNSILYYALLRRLTDNILVRSKNLVINDYTDADEMFTMMKSNRANNIDLEKRTKSIYCFLLEIYILNFSSHKNSKSKIKQLIAFCNSELGVYFEAGTVLAYLYFDNDDTVKKFFQKITPSSKDCLTKIEGMAWDLFHLWDMPTEMAMLSHGNTIFLQSLATGDKALADLIDVNPIERIFMCNGVAVPKYKYNIESLIKDKEIGDEIISNTKNRITILQSVDLIGLSKKLEKELLDLFKTY